MATTQKITPFIGFVDQAEQAVKLYVSLFPDSRVTAVARYPEGAPGPAGEVMTMEFELCGQPYIALNGGEYFKLNDAFSLSVACDSQAEIDELTEQLTAGGGSQGPCGWIKDRFGLSWQLTPRKLGAMMADKDKARAQRVMQAMLQMHKLDIAALERAYAG